MKWLTLELVKAQVRITHDRENELLEHYAELAEERVLTDIERTYEELIAWKGEVPRELIQASLLLVEVYYNYRSGLNISTLSIVPYGSYDVLVMPYKRLAYQKYYDEVSRLYQ